MYSWTFSQIDVADVRRRLTQRAAGEDSDDDHRARWPDDPARLLDANNARIAEASYGDICCLVVANRCITHWGGHAQNKWKCS